MKRLLFGFVFISSLSSAADIVQYDPKTTFCLAYYAIADEFKFMDDKGFPLPGYMIFTDKTPMTNKEVALLLKTTPIYYFKYIGTDPLKDPKIQEMSQAEKDAIDDKSQDDQAKAVGSQYKDFIENNLAIQTMIEEFAKLTGADPIVLRDTIEQSIATKLGLPNL